MPLLAISKNRLPPEYRLTLLGHSIHLLYPKCISILVIRTRGLKVLVLHCWSVNQSETTPINFAI